MGSERRKSKKRDMPSLVQARFLDQVIEPRVEYCHNVVGGAFDATICDEIDVMLICAYIELILPLFSIAGSFFFRKEAAHIWGSNLPALGCVTAGAIYLAMYYGDVIGMKVDSQMLFKAHVGLAMAMSVIGALCMVQVVLSFLGILACGTCCKGERLIGLCAFVFTMIGLVIIFAVPIGSMAIGWTYAFGDCSDKATWLLFKVWLDTCPSL